VAYRGGQVIAGGHWINMNSGATYLPRLVAFDPTTGVQDMTGSPSKQPWSFATDAAGTTIAVGGVFTTVSKTSEKRFAVFQSS
jgi:hypothetical protein